MEGRVERESKEEEEKETEYRRNLFCRGFRCFILRERERERKLREERWKEKEI
jgi:hypothetical protein